MSESGYWTRFWHRQVGRRRLLTGTALGGAGLAAAAVVGCGGGGEEAGGGKTPNAGVTPSSVQAVYPSDGRQQFIPAAANSTGGTYRYMGFDPVVLDRYDPHQTQFGPMYANTSGIFSKLYMYRSHEEPTWENILPDLAESAPEMVEPPPETVTYIIHLRHGVKFHDNEGVRKNFPSLAGRELTADDVIYSYERQRSKTSPQAAYYYRASQYETIASIEKVDDYTIRITTNGPVAPFYHFLADTNAMIIPKEIVDATIDSVDTSKGPKPEERMIGTGPFMWDSLTWGIQFKASRNPNWFGWGEPALGRPYLDGYIASGTGLQDATLESLFRAKDIDVTGFVENPGWVFAIKQEMPELVLHRPQSSGWVNSRLKLNCPPFNDIRVRKALHLATDRQQVVDVIWKGEARMVGPVGGAVKYWALPQDELEKSPGYRQTKAEREQDIADAVAAYSAAGRPAIPQMWNADQPSYIPNFIPTYLETLRKNLGVEIKAISQPYSRIAEGHVKDDCNLAAFTWGFDNGWIDLDDWVYPYFRTGAPKNSFRLSDPELDGMLDAQRKEFDADKRRELGYEIQRYLLGLKGDKAGSYVRLDYATLILDFISWPYFKNRVTFPWFGDSYWNANVWLDRNDPSYQGRTS
ncbi:MAG TPA: ABC transporter substrate-binding protein [Dehalococcoidia bacterium]|nr:ABC transporter substrate-binding protein [Dehalococcoidia bacterium]